MDKARETAMKVLCMVHENGAYANVALVEAFREAKLNNLERRFATELDTSIYETSAPQDGSVCAGNFTAGDVPALFFGQDTFRSSL